MNRRTGCALLVLFAGAGTGALAADACGAYKWDVAREVRLFAAAPTALTLASSAAQAPSLVLDTHYELALQPQESVRYVVPPSKRMLADGAFGGVAKFQVARAGAYRVAIDAGFWIDVVVDGQSLPALDFNGQRECAGPRKIVVYELPANTPLTLQLAAASTSKARLTVTPVAAPAPQP